MRDASSIASTGSHLKLRWGHRWPDTLMFSAMLEALRRLWRDPCRRDHPLIAHFFAPSTAPIHNVTKSAGRDLVELYGASDGQSEIAVASSSDRRRSASPAREDIATLRYASPAQRLPQ
jgi:hypothetical protein